MTTWTRVRSDQRCGGCGTVYPVSTILLAVKLARVKRLLWRCPLCVGEAPPDLPAVLETRSYKQKTAPEPLARIGRRAVADFKLAQAGR